MNAQAHRKPHIAHALISLPGTGVKSEGQHQTLIFYLFSGNLAQCGCICGTGERTLNAD